MSFVDLPSGSISNVLRYVLSSLLLWVISVLIYQSFFHPLRKYPGPLLAKITYGYGGFHAIKGRHHTNTYKNFLRYGRVYREAPNRLMFNSLTAIQDIYTHSNITKAAAYRHPGSQTNESLFAIRDNNEHRRKRKVIGQVVSDRSLRAFQPMMQEQIDIFLQQLLKASRRSEMVNMTTACNRLGVDVVGYMAFGCALKTQTEATNRLIPETMFHGIYMNNVYYTWPSLGRLSPIAHWLGKKQVAVFTQAVARMIAERTSQSVDSKPDFYATVTGDRGLHSSELWGEALFFVLAGGSTVATAICGSLFHLSWHPSVYARLASEIRETFSSGQEIQPGLLLSSCAYLRAVIDESLRMTPPAPSPLWREPEVPNDKPFIVDGHVIPPGTEVGVHLWAIMHDPDNFDDPFTFRPERWLLPDAEDGDETAGEARKSRARMRRAHVAFGLGERSCAGKSMAYMEASLTIAKILWYFDFERAPGKAGTLGCGNGGKDPWDAHDQFQIYDVLGADHDGPNLVFKPRQEQCRDLCSDIEAT
ncbi:cytochrome P450 [Xylariaceae sp. FL1272]|nr:cytochrome P450 [Xylariaceae sp. FL1272]